MKKTPRNLKLTGVFQSRPLPKNYFIHSEVKQVFQVMRLLTNYQFFGGTFLSFLKLFETFPCFENECPYFSEVACWKITLTLYQQHAQIQKDPVRKQEKRFFSVKNLVIYYVYALRFSIKRQFFTKPHLGVRYVHGT